MLTAVVRPITQSVLPSVPAMLKPYQRGRAANGVVRKRLATQSSCGSLTFTARVRVFVQVLALKKEEEEKRRREEEAERARLAAEQERQRKDREREARLKARLDEEVRTRHLAARVLYRQRCRSRRSPPVLPRFQKNGAPQRWQLGRSCLQCPPFW